MLKLMKRKRRRERLRKRKLMTAEEFAGPPGPKITRLLYFVGAAIIVTVAVNKWNDYEKQSNEKRQLQYDNDEISSQQNPSNTVHKAVE